MAETDWEKVGPLAVPTMQTALDVLKLELDTPDTGRFGDLYAAGQVVQRRIGMAATDWGDLGPKVVMVMRETLVALKDELDTLAKKRREDMFESGRVVWRQLAKEDRW